MTRAEYLAALRQKLRRLPPLEVENAISFYEEYLNDAGPEQEQAVLSKLGSPEQLAAKIGGEFAINNAKEKKQPLSLWVILLLVLASPVALPLSIAFVAVVFALVVTIVALSGSILFAGGALAVGGVIALVTGLLSFTSSWATGVFAVGSALVVLSLGGLLVIGSIRLFQYAFLGIQRLVGQFLIRRSKK